MVGRRDSGAADVRGRCNKLPTCCGRGPFEGAMGRALYEHGRSGIDADRCADRELMPEAGGLATEMSWTPNAAANDNPATTFYPVPGIPFHF